MNLNTGAAALLAAFAKKQKDDKPAPNMGEAAIAQSLIELTSDGTENPSSLITRKGYPIIDEMRLDDHLGACMDMKKSARLCTPWKVTPASDENEDVEIAEHVEEELRGLRGTLKEKIRDMLTALEYGVSYTNKIWKLNQDGPRSGRIGLMDLKTKEPHGFKFVLDKYRNATGLLQELPDAGVPEKLNISDFIIYTYRKEFHNPYGQSDFERCYREWNAKRWINTFWLIHLERFATGTIDIKYTPGKQTSQEHEMLKKFITDKQARTGIMHSNVYDISMLETSGRGEAAFKDAITHFNGAMGFAVLLPKLLMGTSDTGGGAYALGKKHWDAFLWVMEDLGRDICETIMGEQVIKPLVDFNYSGVAKYPIFEFDPLSEEQKFQILSQLIAAVEKGVITPDLEVENAARRILELAEKEEEEEPKEKPTPEPEPEPESGPEPIEEDSPPSGFAFQAPRQRRALTTYERKVNFQRIERTLDSLQSQVVKTWSELFRTARKSLIETVRKRRIIKDRLYTEIGKLKLARMMDMQKSLARFMLSTFYSGALEAQQEVERGGRKTFEMPREFQVDLSALPLDEIEKFFQAKGLVLTPAIKAAAREIKNESFWITHVESEKVLSKAKAVLFKALKRGDENWGEGELKRLFEGYLQTGELKAGVLKTEFRIETIMRTNATTSFNEGRKLKFEDKDVEDFIVAYEWSSILDDGTTPYCLELDGKVFRKEELNGAGFPPAHYNCRSVVVPITEGEQFEYSDIPGGVDRGVGFEACEVCAQ